MKRLILLATLAVLAATGGPASSGGAQDAGNGFITVTDASTYDYPGAPDTIVVCVDGQGAGTMDVGDQLEIEQGPGDVVIDIFGNDSASCADTPDRTVTVPLAAGDRLGLVIGWDSLFTFTYDDDCVDPGQTRIRLANGTGHGAPVDVYVTPAEGGDASPLALGVAGGTGRAVSDVAPGTYDVSIVAAGADPYGPTLGFIPEVSLAEGTSTQIFLAGGADGALGGFTFQQGPEICEPEEVPEPTSSTTSTTSTTAPVAPGTATPATPVSGTASYTG